ncbi:hypothetical protein HMPREF0880_04383 [Yokenella regensburgei ATCC 43003]|nr:hypothetical protein HMPREF0880_04383 [Yokenella regensburgei ATCC 43003]
MKNRSLPQAWPCGEQNAKDIFLIFFATFQHQFIIQSAMLRGGKFAHHKEWEDVI